MKLNTALNLSKAETNSIEISDFKIKNSAAAFAVLSSSIYSNKIRAIIRELSCNAYDSHVAAGKADIPFHIHLPSTFECYFSIRDFGADARFVQGEDNSRRQEYDLLFRSARKVGFQPV